MRKTASGVLSLFMVLSLALPAFADSDEAIVPVDPNPTEETETTGVSALSDDLELQSVQDDSTSTDNPNTETSNTSVANITDDESSNTNDPKTQGVEDEAETTTSEKEDQSETTTENQDETIIPTEDDSAQQEVTEGYDDEADWQAYVDSLPDPTGTVTDGLHFTVPYQSMGSYIPSFTIELWEVVKDDEELTSTVVVDSSHYDPEQGSYHFILPFKKGYKVGDKFVFKYLEGDKVIKELAYNQYRNTAIIKQNQYWFFDIGTTISGDGEENYKKYIEFTQNNPVEVALDLDFTTYAFPVKTAEGVLLKNQDLVIKTAGNNTKELKVKTNNQGVLWLKQDQVPDKFMVKALNYEDFTVKLPAQVQTKQQEYFHSQDIELKPVTKQSNGEETALTGVTTAKITSKYSNDLSSRWMEVDIKYKDDPVTYTLTPDNNLIYNSQGKKIEKVTSKHAKVDSYKLNGTTLDITLTPNHTLEVTKGKKAYNFSVINKSDKQYKGSATHAFGVVAGETYMIQDNDTGTIHNATIDDKTSITRVVLGQGVVFGGSASTPHTGDGIMILVLFLAIALIGVGVSLSLYKKGHRPSKKNASATLLSLLLIISLFPAIPAYAGVTGEEGVDGSGNKPKDDQLTSSETTSLLRVGFIPNSTSNGKPLLGENSTEGNMKNASKFSNNRYLFYLPPDNTVGSMLRSGKSGIVSVNTGGSEAYKIKALHGVSPLAEAGNPATLNARLLQSADTSKGSDNPFIREIATAVSKVSGNSTQRVLSDKDIGNTIQAHFDSLNVADETKDVNKNGEKIFEGYVKLLEERGIADASYIKTLEADYAEGNLVLFVELLTGFHEANKSSSNQSFMTVHDGVELVDYIRSKDPKKEQTSYGANRERQYIDWIHCNGKSIDNCTDKDKLQRPGLKTPANLEHYEFTFQYIGFARKAYVRALGPKSSKAANANTDYFGGWGYITWGKKDVANNPEITVDLELDVYNKDDVKVKTVTIPKTRWTEADKRILNALDPENPDDMKVFFSNQISHNGEVYEIYPSSDINIHLKDIRDDENIRKFPLLKSGKGEDAKVTAPSENGEQWYIDLGFDVPEPLEMHTYLGGEDEEHLHGADNKYFEKLDKDGKPDYSHAKIIVKAKAKMDEPDEPVDNMLEVPQWRLSKYFEDISPEEKVRATFSLSLPISTGRSPSLSPSSVTFQFKEPDLSAVKWAITKAKLFDGDVPHRSFSARQSFQKEDFILAGDLLAIKTNDTPEVDNIKGSNWVDGTAPLLENRIGTAVQGVDGKQASQIQKHSFIYEIVDPGTFTYSETRQYEDCTTDDETGEEDCNWVDYRWSGSASKSQTDSQYDISVRFLRYLPLPSVATPTFDEEKENENSFYYETKQSIIPLSVNPEVLMFHSDEAGNNATYFTAGDKMREMLPVHYNTLGFERVKVDTQITGTSVATDAKAKQLAMQKGSGGKDVIYKGSPTTNSFAVEGDIEVKTFAIDIGNVALKNTWNPGTTYNTEDVRDEFLERHGEKNAEGKWVLGVTVERGRNNHAKSTWCKIARRIPSIHRLSNV